MAFGSPFNWMNAFPLPFTRPSSTPQVGPCPRLMVLTTLMTPCNFQLAFLNLLSHLFHLNFVQPKLTGPPLTRPPPTRPRHRTCPSGAPWPVGKPRGPTSCPQFAAKRRSRFRSQCLRIVSQIELLGWKCRAQYATSLPFYRPEYFQSTPKESFRLSPGTCQHESNGSGKWSNSSIKGLISTHSKSQPKSRIQCRLVAAVQRRIAFYNPVPFKWYFGKPIVVAFIISFCRLPFSPAALSSPEQHFGEPIVVSFVAHPPPSL